MDFILKPPAARLHRAHNDNEFSYVSPPLDGSLTVAELYDFHYAHNPDHTVFLHADGDAVKHLRYREVVPAAYNAARFIARAVGIDIDAGQRPPTTLAILASSDTITSFTTILGMLRGDITFFMISSKYSAASIAHLLTSTPDVSHLCVSQERRKLAETAIQQIEGIRPTLCMLPTFPELYQPGSIFVPFRCDPKRKDLSATRFILHSSGKVDIISEAYLLERSHFPASFYHPLYGERDLLGEVFGCFGTTLHQAGGLFLVAWVASIGITVATFPPAILGVEVGPDTLDMIWDAFLKIKPTYLYSGPPIVIEQWFKDPTKIPFLKQLPGGIVFMGAPLRKAVGDALAREGCSLHTHYGSTEAGTYCMLFQGKSLSSDTFFHALNDLEENPGLDWEYFIPNPQCGLKFIPLEDGRFEMVVVSQATTELTVVDTTFDGIPAFRTKDIVEPHSTLPNRWKVVGRVDDVILLASGVKTIPGPLEDIIRGDPHIRSAIMFGNGKSTNGVLIDLEPGHAFDPQCGPKLDRFRDLIWPVIDAANAFGSRFARIPRELVLVAAPEKPFQYTVKGQPKRSAILKEYSEEIEAIYAVFEKDG